MRDGALPTSVSDLMLGQPSPTNTSRSVPDLAYHSMKFLSHAKRRCHLHESDMGPGEGRARNKERERDESALFADDSPFNYGIHDEESGDQETVDSLPRPRFDLNTQPAV